MWKTFKEKIYNVTKYFQLDRYAIDDSESIQEEKEEQREKSIEEKLSIINGHRFSSSSVISGISPMSPKDNNDYMRCDKHGDKHGDKIIVYDLRKYSECPLCKEEREAIPDFLSESDMTI